MPGIGPVLARRVLDAFNGSPEAVFRASPASLAAIDGIGTVRAKNFANAPSMADVQMEMVCADGAGIQIITPDDDHWPAGLRNIPDPPIILYVRGELAKHDILSIGIVGSRHCTHYGREQAERFGAMLAQANMTVVSGGARGIDTGAHEGALRAGGRTIAIMGCGLLNVYPPENKKLYDRIVTEKRGAIISELPLNAQPLAEHFPPRNRIIAGMSLGVLVIEASMKSGSLITARLAGDHCNREVFAVPGRVDSPASSGTHHLIKSGQAHLVENVQDILDQLGDTGKEISKSFQATPEKQQVPPAKHNHDTTGPDAVADNRKSIMNDHGPNREAPLFENAMEAVEEEKHVPISVAPTIRGGHLTQVQEKILNVFIGGDELNVDDICERSGLPVAVIMAELTMLQIRGTIKRLTGNKFTVNRK